MGESRPGPSFHRPRGQGGRPGGLGRPGFSVTIDANVLVYASNSADHVHGTARAIIERLAEGPEIVYLFWPTVMGYLRIVTHPAILPRPLGPLEAASNVSKLLERAHVRSPGEEDGFWDLYRKMAGDRSRGNDVPDAHLVTLMLQHGVRVLYSRDRAFRRFDRIEVRDPFISPL